MPSRIDRGIIMSCQPPWLSKGAVTAVTAVPSEALSSSPSPRPPSFISLLFALISLLFSLTSFLISLPSLSSRRSLLYALFRRRSRWTASSRRAPTAAHTAAASKISPPAPKSLPGACSAHRPCSCAPTIAPRTSCRPRCRRAAPPSHSSRRLSRDGERVSAKQNSSVGGVLVAPAAHANVTSPTTCRERRSVQERKVKPGLLHASLWLRPTRGREKGGEERREKGEGRGEGEKRGGRREKGDEGTKREGRRTRGGRGAVHQRNALAQVDQCAVH